jgi:hypothetical protein
MKTKLVVILILLTMVGCATSERKQFAATAKTHSELVESGTLLYEAGDMSKDDFVTFVSLANRANTYIQLWKENILAGNPRPDLKAIIEPLMDELFLFYMEFNNED